MKGTSMIETEPTLYPLTMLIKDIGDQDSTILAKPCKKFPKLILDFLHTLPQMMQLGYFIESVYNGEGLFYKSIKLTTRFSHNTINQKIK